jgi:hypothetical protein
VVTSWDDVPEPKWQGVFKVWEGGLGIWGGILFGVLVGAIVIKRAGGSVLQAMDAVAPALLLAQAIGRFGNWWNQELYGKPTDLPWGLEIDDAHNQDYPPGTTFHPTFLYEALWNFAGFFMLLIVDRRWKIRPPALFSLYVAWYTVRPVPARAAADRPVVDVLGHAAERVGLARALHRVVPVLHLLADLRRAAAEAELPAAASGREEAAGDGRATRAPLAETLARVAACPSRPQASAPGPRARGALLRPQSLHRKSYGSSLRPCIAWCPRPRSSTL